MITLEIRPLTTDHIPSLVRFLADQSDEYLRYFKPFSFEFAQLKNMMEKIVLDRYFCLFIDGDIAVFFMLRGFDQGYEIPSFGIIVDSRFKGFGLASLCLQFCITNLKLMRVKKLMLKVYSENLSAIKVYESAGFYFSHIEEKSGQLVYYRDI